MSRSTTYLVRSLAVVALVTGLGVSADGFAATPKYTLVNSTGTAMGREDRTMSIEQRVEERIKNMHDKLNITSEQDDDWNDVAEAMRENEKEMHALIQERHEKAGDQSALDDLRSYQKIASAHADGIGRFIKAFQSLYESMSDAQKKNADTVFGSFEGRMMHRRMGPKGTTK